MSEKVEITSFIKPLIKSEISEELSNNRNRIELNTTFNHGFYSDEHH